MALVALSLEECYLAALLDDPTGIDLAEFAFIDEENDDGCFRLHDYQWLWLSCMDTRQADQSSRDLGKALALDTPIPIPGGWATMGALQVGDKVYDERGRPTVVTHAFAVQRNRPCFEVEFSDGTIIVADGEHLWETWDKKARHDGGRPRVRTTVEVADSLLVSPPRPGRYPEYRHSIPVAGPLRGVQQDLMVSPYVLGYWLGDGSSYSAQITIGDRDRKEVLALLGSEGVVLKKVSAPLQYGVTYPGVDKYLQKVHSLTADLRRLDVLRNKHIPIEYLGASLDDRLALLQGLMDSDGHITKGGRCELTLTCRPLAIDAAELIRSLGWAPYVAEGRAKLNGRDVGPRWRIGWQPSPDRSPFRLRRKVERLRWPSNEFRTGHRRIVGVRSVASVPVRCIAVASPRSLFLAGEGMVPTHNTLSIAMRGFAFCFNFPGQEMCITAPELNHLRPITDILEAKITGTRLSSEMLPKNRGRGMARQPQWQVRFANNARIVTRLPNKDGRGIKGIHSTILEMDEGQDYPLAGWVEIIETFKERSKNAIWRVHGVPRGVRDKYFEVTQDDSGFTVHRKMAMMRPDWSKHSRDQRVKTYGGSRQNPDYRRNVYGEHGDATNPVFVMARLMNRVDLDEASEYNTDIYQIIRLSGEQITPTSPLDLMLEQRRPLNHVENSLSLKGYSHYWGGQDVGLTVHPSEILMFGQRTGSDHLDLLLRVNLLRVEAPDQIAIVDWLFDLYGKKLRFGIDQTGLGFPIYQELARKPYGDRVHGYNFSPNVDCVVGFEDRELKIKPNGEYETMEDLAIERPLIEHTTDVLRSDWVDAKKVTLPFDRELLTEFQGQSYTILKNAGSPYGRRTYSQGAFHCLDAARMAAAVRTLPPIELMMATKRRQDALEQFPGEYAPGAPASMAALTDVDYEVLDGVL